MCPGYMFLSACACRLTAPQARKFLLGWLSWTPINSHRELRSPPKIANANRWIFDCDSHSHIAAVSSALRQLERNSRCGYRGVHTLYDRPYGTLTGGCTVGGGGSCKREMLLKPRICGCASNCQTCQRAQGAAACKKRKSRGRLIPMGTHRQKAKLTNKSTRETFSSV